MEHPSRPRYVKATLLTALAAALLPVGFLVLAYFEYKSPQWDPEGDSGAVQGFMVIALATTLSILYVLVAFPVAANTLRKASKLRGTSFGKLLAMWLGGISLVVAAAVSLQLGGLSLWLPLALVLFLISALLTMPFMPLWLWLAR
jgi:hypothetical protein